MELKELVRNLVHGELEDIAAYEQEAELFDKTASGDLRNLFLALAEEKRGRLPPLKALTRASVARRQRKTEPPRSAEAALRAHCARAENQAGLYAQYAKLLDKPERRQLVLEFAAAEYRGLQALRSLQQRLKENK